jgi:hypothetical protein
MAAQSATDRRRALELLAGSARQGCTEAFLLVLADMVRAGLATAQIEPRDIWIVAHIGDFSASSAGLWRSRTWASHLCVGFHVLRSCCQYAAQ